MLYRSVCALLIVGLALSLFSASTEAAEGFLVRFRLENWKSLHLNQQAEADEMLKQLQKLGIEAKQTPHNGHIDVVYRCPQWKALTTKTDEAAHQWENWLKKLGFQTDHKH